MKNHIEYDEEEYNKLLISLGNIRNSISSSFDGNCEAIKSTIDSFYDDYASSSVSSIKSSLFKHINQINNLKSTVNYSLLAYKACDNELVEVANKLIDHLFSEKETSLAKVFKKNVMSMVDTDSNNIMDYKKNIDYTKVYQELLPVYQYVDEEGNTLYLNSKRMLIGTSGEHVKIKFGGETFFINYLENGALQLVDLNNNPLSIFKDYNIDSLQYGANQYAFRDNVDELLKDENILGILNSYLPNISLADQKKFLLSIASSGCGYSSITNAIFKELEGKEDKFLDTFGYQMYNVYLNKDSSSGIVDYNYEPIMLDLYTYNLKNNDINHIVESLDGVYSKSVPLIFNDFNKKHHLFDEDCATVLERNGYYSDMGFNLYDMAGNTVFLGGGGHVMTKISELDSNRWIVSTYGKKLICEINNPKLDWNYVSED